MIDPGKGAPIDRDLAAQLHLRDNVVAGRITEYEAGVIARFFAFSPRSAWPASNLQRRMQSEAGPAAGVGAKPQA